jgi:hypothetical protein
MNNKTIAAVADALLATSPDTPVRVRLLRDVLPGSRSRELRLAMAELKKHPAYAALREVQVVKLSKDRDDAVIGRLKGSLREGGDVFRAAAKIGVTGSDPHMAILIKTISSYVKRLYRTKPWNDTGLDNRERYAMFSRLLGLPGALALITPTSPVVVAASKKVVAQVTKHYEAQDYSIQFEDSMLNDIYGADMFTEESLANFRRMAYCTTEYSSIYTANIFRLAGVASKDLDRDICHRYCDHMLRRHELIKGWVPAQEQIIAGTIPGERPGTLAAVRPDVFAREIARHLIQIQDQMLFPCWREFAKPFIEWLWNQHQDDGFWDFGPVHNGSGDADRLRLSRNWRSNRRYQDWTISILLIMKEYYRESVPNNPMQATPNGAPDGSRWVEGEKGMRKRNEKNDKPETYTCSHKHPYSGIPNIRMRS